MGIFVNPSSIYKFFTRVLFCVGINSPITNSTFSLLGLFISSVIIYFSSYGREPDSSLKRSLYVSFSQYLLYLYSDQLKTIRQFCQVFFALGKSFCGLNLILEKAFSRYISLQLPLKQETPISLISLIIRSTKI